MEKARALTVSAAVFVLICFFLPWVQVSCAGFKDSASGFDLARGDGVLWLAPLLMLAVVLLGVMRVRKKTPAVFALLSILAGAVSAYLMNRERANAEQSLGLVGAHVTGWFWLGLVSSLAVAAGAIRSYLKRPNHHGPSV
jgi:hypothetical protein